MLVSLCLQVLQEDCFIPTAIGEGGCSCLPVMPPNLTPRQQEILWLVAEGQSNKQIARRLSVAEGTIKNQLYSMYRVLGVSNRTEASRWWLRTAQGAANKTLLALLPTLPYYPYPTVVRLAVDCCAGFC